MGTGRATVGLPLGISIIALLLALVTTKGTTIHVQSCLIFTEAFNTWDLVSLFVMNQLLLGRSLMGKYIVLI